MNALGEYQGIRIDYHHADDTFVNATQMCKATGKLWGSYWRNQSTQEFISALSSELKCANSHILDVAVGRGNETWVHRRVAIHLAQWCSAEFAVWVSGKIEQLMTTGRVVLHSEHQEAELVTNPVASQLLSRIDDTLTELKTQRVENAETLADNARNYGLCIQTLRALQQRSPNRIESVVRDELIKIEGGLPEVELAPGHRLDVLIPDRWAIEVKWWKDYKSAVGQITLYSKHLGIDEEKRIHLFWKPLDTPPSERVKERIEKECRSEGIHVTWHAWELVPPEESQQLLSMSY